MPAPPRRGLALVGFLALSYAAAAVGSLFPPGDWYAALEKPSWTPPGWIFGPVWTVLYALMGVAAWLVWQRRGAVAGVKLALGFWVAQLVCNGLWSWLFFGLHRPGLAFGDLAALFILLLSTMGAFFRIRPLAGWLLAPYAAWAAYAGVLNFALWRLNA